jgi:hypothetical protein
MKIISQQQALEIIKSQKGKFFSVIFEKRTNGLDRKMLCQQKNRGIGKMKYNPSDYNLLNVFDLNIKEYRNINLSGLKKLKANKTEYAIR